MLLPNVATRAGRTGEGAYELTPLPNGGTRIAFEYRWIVTPLIDRLTAPVARAFIRRNNVTAMRRLAEQLDRHASTPEESPDNGRTFGHVQAPP